MHPEAISSAGAGLTRWTLELERPLRAGKGKGRSLLGGMKPASLVFPARAVGNSWLDTQCVADVRGL
jgi:hypothetical protein